MKDFFNKLLEYFKDVDVKNIIERAFWTFVEGFLLSIPIISPDNFTDFINGSWKMVLAGAIGFAYAAFQQISVDGMAESAFCHVYQYGGGGFLCGRLLKEYSS